MRPLFFIEKSIKQKNTRQSSKLVYDEYSKTAIFDIKKQSGSMVDMQ